MDIILFKVIEKNKLYLIISTIIYIIFFFFIGGNNRLLSLSNASEGISANVALDKYLSINNIKVLLLFFLIGGACAYIFRDKEIKFKDIIDRKENRTKYFKNILIELYLPLFIGIVMNFIVKIILFYSFKGKINESVSPLVIGTSFVYLSIISLFIGALFLLGAIALKNPMKSILFPILIIDILILLFSIGSFIIGETVPFIKNIINLILYPILKLIDGFFFYFKFELMFFENQLVILLLLAVMSALPLLFAYKGIVYISESDYKSEFRCRNVRKFLFLSIVAIGVLGALLLASGVISLLLNSIKLMDALLIGEVLSLLLIPIIYIKINKIYMNNREQELLEVNDAFNEKFNEKEGVLRFEDIELNRVNDKIIEFKDNSKIKRSGEFVKKKSKKFNKEKVIEFKTKSGGKVKNNKNNTDERHNSRKKRKK